MVSTLSKSLIMESASHLQITMPLVSNYECLVHAVVQCPPALKHNTSKLSTFEDLSSVETFGFRGEALASLCALSGAVTITTATATTAPVGTILELDRLGRVVNRSGRVARQVCLLNSSRLSAVTNCPQRGTTVTVSNIFKPLPVRRKELERNAKREFGKALNLLTAYALIPCTHYSGGIRLTVSNQSSSG